MWWKSREHNADLLAYEGDYLTFQVDRKLSLGHSVEVEAHLPDGLHFEARLVPAHEVEPDEGLQSYIHSLGYAPRKHVYCGRLEEPTRSEEHLRVLLERLPADSTHHHRQAFRLPRQVSVMSPALPKFHATTTDISLTGICLRTDSPLEPGLVLPLEVVFDEVPFPPLKTEARVCWCRPLHPEARHDGYLVGAHFQGLRQGQQRELEDFVHAALRKEPFPSDSP